MGSQRKLIEGGGFSEYLYKQVGETLYMNGLKCKTIVKIDAKDKHDGLPLYSNTSDIYFKISNKTGEVEQIRVYENRKPLLDIDWGHEHQNEDTKMTFPIGVAHVQEWSFDSKSGKPVRSEIAHFITDVEFEKYGEIIKKVYPNIKFRL